LAGLKEKAWTALKWLWLVGVVGVAAYYAIKNFDEVQEKLRSFSISSILVSVLLLSVGKLLLAELSKRSVRAEKWEPSFREMFYINSLTQLAKYIPGGIWHFVGRLGIYRANRLDMKEASVAIVVENSWLVGSAFVVGVMMSFPYLARTYLDLSQLQNLAGIHVLALLIMVALWVVALWLVERFRDRVVSPSWVSLSWNFLLQLAIWALIGASFLALQFEGQDLAYFGLVVGGFSLSWAVGYVTVFAPGGLGAREAVLAAVFASVIPPQDTLILAAVHRIIWVGTELLLGGCAALAVALQPGTLKFTSTQPSQDASREGGLG
jgi:hypothetical protein